MHLVAIGLDHHRTPVELRERLAFSPNQQDSALRQLVCPPGDGAHHPVTEALIVSTCNRVEIYALTDDVHTAHDHLTQFLAGCHGVGISELDPFLYRLHGADTIAHLCAVAAGIRSLVIGEPQIKGQMKESFELAQTTGAIGPILSAACRAALRAGKRARTETAISQHAVSVSHAGVELARKIFGDLSPLHVLLVGSGQMSQLAAKTLIEQGARDLTVVNRSLDRAKRMAAPFGGCTLRLDELGEGLKHSDIVISSTAAREPIIDVGMVKAAMRARKQRSLFLIDIAVPRDIDPAVGKLENVFLYDIDNLQDVRDANLNQRRKEIHKVEAIVAQETAHFMRWFDSLSVSPTIVELRHQAEEIRRAEVEKALRRLDTLSDRERNIIEALSKGIVNKLLHRPTVRLKAEATNGSGHVYTSTLRDLFGLTGEEPQ